MEKRNKVSVDFKYATIHFCPAKTTRSFSPRAKKQGHYSLWKHVIKTLAADEWCIYVEPRYANKGIFQRLRAHNRSGMKGFANCTLEFSTDTYDNGFKFEFFQNHIFENSSGGQYDFDKYEKMPYLLKKAFELTANKITQMILKQCPSSDVCINDDRRMTSEQLILKDESHRSFTRNKMQSLNDTPKFMSKYDFKNNSLDKDKKLITCGETKYTYGWNGRLQKGTVYHNINNMWWFIWNDSYHTNISSYDLFDLTPARLANRRSKTHRPPKQYLEQMAALDKCSVKQLKNALKQKLQHNTYGQEE